MFPASQEFSHSINQTMSKKIKRILRLILLIFFMILASVGMALPFNFNSRDKYMNNETKIELVERKDEDEEDLKDVEEVRE